MRRRKNHRDRLKSFGVGEGVCKGVGPCGWSLRGKIDSVYQGFRGDVGSHTCLRLYDTFECFSTAVSVPDREPKI